jgi:hypothetical protein
LDEQDYGRCESTKIIVITQLLGLKTDKQWNIALLQNFLMGAFGSVISSSLQLVFGFILCQVIVDFL